MKNLLRKYANYLLDLLLALSGFATLASSYVVWFILPRGIGLHGALYCFKGGTGAAGNSQYFLGLFRYTWISIHNWASVVLFVIIFLHILLHWRWIVATTRRFSDHLQRRARKVLELYGAALLLLLLFVFECISGLVLWLVLPRGAQDYSATINASGRSFLGLHRILWVDLHAWVAVTIVSIVIVHLVLNWSWVVGVTRRIFLPTGRQLNP